MNVWLHCAVAAIVSILAQSVIAGYLQRDTSKTSDSAQVWLAHVRMSQLH